jgi:hypothetical protein
MSSFLKESISMKIPLTAAILVLLISLPAACEEESPFTILFTSDTQGRLVPSG